MLTHCLQDQIGGKLVVLSSSLPSVGAGALKDREDPKVFGTTKVCPSALSLAVQDSLRIACSRNQLSSTRLLRSTSHSLSIAQGRMYPSICSSVGLGTRMLRLLVRLSSCLGRKAS